MTKAYSGKEIQVLLSGVEPKFKMTRIYAHYVHFFVTVFSSERDINGRNEKLLAKVKIRINCHKDCYTVVFTDKCDHSMKTILQLFYVVLYILNLNTTVLCEAKFRL